MTVFKGQRPFSGRLLGVAISFVVMLILLAMLAQRLDREIDTVERVQFQMRLAELQSAVLLRYASLVARNKTEQAESYIGMNPMKLLSPGRSERVSLRTGETIEPPEVLWPTYLGERSMLRTEQTGVWVFDPEYNVIAYRPRSTTWLKGWGEKDLEWLQFQVVGLWSENDSNNQIKEGNPSENTRERLKLKGLELKALQEVSWIER